jgi:hypothetical protein
MKKYVPDTVDFMLSSSLANSEEDQPEAPSPEEMSIRVLSYNEYRNSNIQIQGVELHTYLLQISKTTDRNIVKNIRKLF